MQRRCLTTKRPRTRPCASSYAWLGSFLSWFPCSCSCLLSKWHQRYRPVSVSRLSIRQVGARCSPLGVRTGGSFHWRLHFLDAVVRHLRGCDACGSVHFCRHDCFGMASSQVCCSPLCTSSFPYMCACGGADLCTLAFCSLRLFCPCLGSFVGRCVGCERAPLGVLVLNSRKHTCVGVCRGTRSRSLLESR